MDATQQTGTLMMTTWSIQRKLTTGYALILCIIVLMMVLFTQNYLNLIQITAQRDSSRQTILAIERLLDHIYMAELTRQSYLLTGDTQLIASLQNLNQDMESELQTIQQFIRDDPLQSQRLHALPVLLENRRAAWDKTFQAYQSDKQLPQSAMVAYTAHEQRWLGDSRQLLSTISQDEVQQTEYFDRQLAYHLQWSLVIGSILAGMVVVILVSLYWSLHQEMRKRQHAQDALRHSLEREQQARLEAEQANQQKTRILSFVAHDFKNPLAAIDRFVGMLQQTYRAMTPQQRELIDYIQEGTGQLQAMVTSVLDRARMEEGQLHLSLDWIEFRDLLRELHPLITAMAEPQHIQVDTQLDPDLRGIQADPRFLRQILLNLLSNAIKYNRPHGRVDLIIQPADPDRHFVQIDVRDTGIGIPTDKIPKLFQAYFRVQSDLSRQVEGSGLGLAFTNKLVELHGGHIQVESREGVGSVFHVLLPNPHDPHAAPASPHQTTLAHRPQQNPPSGF